VVACDGESTDGTQEAIREWAKQEPKLKLCVYHLSNPVGNIEFWVDWLNYAREHLTTDYHFQLDADEILSERSYPMVLDQKADSKHSVWCKRYNFWRDHHNLVPAGVMLSDRVCRMAPQSVWLPSDGPHPRGAEAIGMAVESSIEIFHYGFLRRPAAFFKKERYLQNMFFGSYDARLVKVESKAGNWMIAIEDVEWINQLVPYESYHPAIARKWLEARGYQV
jgi:glycosyltransferase involved in cell wall biosynthesis